MNIFEFLHSFRLFAVILSIELILIVTLIFDDLMMIISENEYDKRTFIYCLLIIQTEIICIKNGCNILKACF